MTYQFVHEETYGRKYGRSHLKHNAKSSMKKKISIKSLVEEAIREPHATPHVMTPEPPIYLRQSNLKIWAQNIVEQAEGAKDSLGRKLRIDRQIISAGITSYPMLSTDFKNLSENSPDQQQVEKWLKRNLAWLMQQYGDSLGPVLLHLDEQYVHIHYYVEPEKIYHKHGYELVPRHPGFRAKREAAKKGIKSVQQNKIFKEAMRRFQDDYWINVGLPSGFTRIGPGRRRLSRSNHMQEVTAAKSVQKAEKQAKQIKRHTMKEAQDEAKSLIETADKNTVRHRELVEQLTAEEGELHFANARLDGLEEGLKKGMDDGYQAGFKRGVQKGMGASIKKIADNRDALLTAISEEFDPVSAQKISIELDRFLSELKSL